MRVQRSGFSAPSLYGGDNRHIGNIVRLRKAFLNLKGFQVYSRFLIYFILTLSLLTTLMMAMLAFKLEHTLIGFSFTDRLKVSLVFFLVWSVLLTFVISPALSFISKFSFPLNIVCHAALLFALAWPIYLTFPTDLSVTLVLSLIAHFSISFFQHQKRAPSDIQANEQQADKR